VTDGIAQVKRLLEQGVQPHKILLSGYSLGGGIATLVARHFQQKGINLYLFNDRSFSSLDSVLVGHLRAKNKTGHREFLLRKVLGFIIQPVLKFLIALFGWSINAANAYKKLSDKYKTYLVVRSTPESREEPDWYGTPGKSDYRDNVLLDDANITHYASLAYSEEKTRASVLSWQPRHMRCLNRSDNGHNLGLAQMVNAYDPETTGQDFYRKFVNSMS
jgi:hypothetical protein